VVVTAWLPRDESDSSAKGDGDAPDNLAVALVLLDGAVSYPRINGSTRILVVVRDPLTNDTHPNVVSMPTARVPRIFLSALWPESVDGSTFGWTTLTPWKPKESTVHGGHEASIHVVRAILSQKLGMGDALELGTFRFDAGVIAATSGWSHYGAGRIPHSERLMLVTLLVAVSCGARVIPERTASYAAIRWVPLWRFMRAAVEKNPSCLGLDPFELCIHGLCIASAYDVAAWALGHAPYERTRDSLAGDIPA
jgi:hypothetical protein